MPPSEVMLRVRYSPCRPTGATLSLEWEGSRAFAPGPVRPGGRVPKGVSSSSRSLGLFDRCRDHLRIGADPLGLLDEFAALGLVDLHPAAALVVGRGDVERRHQPAEGEIVDRLEPLLDLFTGRLLAAIRLDRVADRLDMERRDQEAAVVHD